MQQRYITFRTTVLALVLFLSTSIPIGAQPSPGQAGPDFTLKDAKGAAYVLSALKNHQMAVLYFFDGRRRDPSQEGLAYLDTLKKALSRRQPGGVGRYHEPRRCGGALCQTGGPRPFRCCWIPAKSAPTITPKPFCPTICVLGPDRKILDVFQGGGKTTEILLVRLAERTLSQKNQQMAKAISDTVIAKNPDNIEAKTVKGYVEMKSGNLEAAEDHFPGCCCQPRQTEKCWARRGSVPCMRKRVRTKKAVALARPGDPQGPQKGIRPPGEGRCALPPEQKRGRGGGIERSRRQTGILPPSEGRGPE